MANRSEASAAPPRLLHRPPPAGFLAGPGKEGRFSVYLPRDGEVVRWTEGAGGDWSGPVPLGGGGALLPSLSVGQGADGYVHLVGIRPVPGGGPDHVELVHTIQYQTGRPALEWRSITHPNGASYRWTGTPPWPWTASGARTSSAATAAAASACGPRRTRAAGTRGGTCTARRPTPAGGRHQRLGPRRALHLARHGAPALRAARVGGEADPRGDPPRPGHRGHPGGREGPLRARHGLLRGPGGEGVRLVARAVAEAHAPRRRGRHRPAVRHPLPRRRLRLHRPRPAGRGRPARPRRPPERAGGVGRPLVGDGERHAEPTAVLTRDLDGRLVAAVLSGGSSLLLTRQRPAADGFVLENWRPVR